MTPERIAAAARLVRRGQVFCLDMPLGSVSPALAMFRGAPRHNILHQPGSVGFDDVYDNFYPQASSQWDSLAHVGYAPDQMYNGVTEQEVLAGTRNTIDHWARHGLAGRAVLLDVERAMREAGLPYDPGGSSAIGVDGLELAPAPGRGRVCARRHHPAAHRLRRLVCRAARPGEIPAARQPRHARG